MRANSNGSDLETMRNDLRFEAGAGARRDLCLTEWKIGRNGPLSALERSRRGPEFTQSCTCGSIRRQEGNRCFARGDPGVFAESIPEQRDLFWSGEDRTLPDGSTLGGTFRARHQGAHFLDRVIFPGEVSDAELESYLAQCDVFVAPSRYESFGLVFLEAMMFSKPTSVAAREG